jgi:hypothetical protein
MSWFAAAYDAFLNVLLPSNARLAGPSSPLGTCQRCPHPAHWRKSAWAEQRTWSSATTSCPPHCGHCVRADGMTITSPPWHPDASRAHLSPLGNKPEVVTFIAPKKVVNGRIQNFREGGSEVMAFGTVCPRGPDESSASLGGLTVFQVRMLPVLLTYLFVCRITRVCVSHCDCYQMTCRQPLGDTCRRQ